METNSNFSIQRIGYLIRKDIWESRKIAGIIGMAVFGFFFMMFMTFSRKSDMSPHHILYPMLLFIGGFIFTSVIFRELYTKPRGQFYLTLPASNFEKLSSKWLISAILYPIGITIFYWVFSIIGNAIYIYWNGESLIGFLTISEELKTMIPSYIVLQAIFFLGAITFTKYNIFKTFFSVFALGMFLTIVFGFLFRFVMWDYFAGMTFNPEKDVVMQLEVSSSIEVFVQDYVLNIVKYLFWLGFAPFLLLVSYFKLKEREI